MCSGTIVLSDVKVIDCKIIIGYVGYAEELIEGIFIDEVVVADQNIVTSQGLAKLYPFAYKVAEIFGKDTSVLSERILYNFDSGK